MIYRISTVIYRIKHSSETELRKTIFNNIN